MRHTKIICTLGPSTSSYQSIKLLVSSGMNAARFNMSHGTHEGHLKMLERTRRVSRAARRHVAAILDTRGSEIRTRNKEPIELKKGETVVFGKSGIPVDKKLFTHAKKGKRMLLDDGRIELIIVSKEKGGVKAKVVSGGLLKARKSVVIPGTRFTQPFLSTDDKQDLKFAIRNDFDYIAASFTRSGEDVRALRSFLRRNGGSQKIIAKIENRQGVDNIDLIIREADGVMVARGDLGIEITFEKVPGIQKMIVRKCVQQGKQVIIATQMLESMVENTRPTRAEAGDIANAVWQGASAIMLSEETAIGKNPIAALVAMSRTAENAEKNITGTRQPHRKPAVADAISAAITTLVDIAEIKQVICFTRSGFTAHLVSKERLKIPIIALTREEKVANWLSLEYGVIPKVVEEREYGQEKIKEAAIEAKKQLKKGELFIVTYGTQGKQPGTTDTIHVLKA